MTRFNAQAWDAFTGRRTVEETCKEWDRRADSYACRSRTSPYVTAFILRLKALPEWTALDVGSGPGTIAIELAPSVRHVTAIDISGRMLENLHRIADEHDIGNIDTLHCSWEDDWDAKGVPTVDLAYASRSVASPNLPALLRKLDSHARRRVCLTTIHGDYPRHDRVLTSAVGRSMPTSPDYIEVVDCLYEMGIYATVDFIPGSVRDVYANRDDALKKLIKSLGETTVRERALLDRFLDKHLITCEDGLTLDYDRGWVWAFIAWDK